MIDLVFLHTELQHDQDLLLSSEREHRDADGICLIVWFMAKTEAVC